MRISKEHGTHISLNTDITDTLVEVIPGIEDANLDDAVNAIVDKVREHIKHNSELVTNTMEEIVE